MIYTLNQKIKKTAVNRVNVQHMFLMFVFDK